MKRSAKSALHLPPEDVAGFDARRLGGDSVYDPNRAEHVVEFFRRFLKHVKGPDTGKPFELADWQATATRTLFGWRRPDGRRRFTRVYLECGRKNGKTTWLAGLLCYCMFCEKQARQGAELYSAAATRDQAALLFGIVAEMIRQEPALAKRARIGRSTYRINRLEGGFLTNTYYRAIPAEAAQTHGYNATFLANDELHAWKDPEFYEALCTSTGNRVEPLQFDATTAGYDRNSICWRQHEYACRVRDGKIDDDAFLPILYSAGEKDDFRKPSTWRKANPCLGKSIRIEYLKAECARAVESKLYENVFRRLHLSQWTQQEERFLQMEHWRKCAGSIDVAELAGQECYGGLDLSATRDLTAFVLVFPRPEGYMIQTRLWLPAETVDERERTDKVPYRQWERDGHVSFTPGISIDYDYIHHQVLNDAEAYDLRMVGYDPWNAEATRQRLESEGVTMVQMRQGAKTFTAPLKELERACVAGELVHDGNPCMEWQAESLEVISDPNANIRPVKPSRKESGKRIDGMVALTMAIGLTILRPEPVEFSDDCFLTLEM